MKFTDAEFRIAGMVALKGNREEVAAIKRLIKRAHKDEQFRTKINYRSNPFSLRDMFLWMDTEEGNQFWNDLDTKINREDFND